MNRWSLSLPVCLLGVPVLLWLLLTSTPAGQGGSPVAPEEPPPVVFNTGPLPSDAQMETLAREGPVGFLENCLRRYQREVKSYRCVMQKQERIDGKLEKKEIIEVFFREEPHSVLFIWQEGARRAERALYVEGENGGKMLARPNGGLARAIAGDVVERDVAGADARQSGRYTLNKFGIKNGMVRTLAAWKAAKEKGTLDVKYLGEKEVPEANNRRCFVLRRTADKPENDGVVELTIFVDRETWLQVGSILKGEDGKLIAEYFFRDIRLNPTFAEDQFKKSALTPKS